MPVVYCVVLKSSMAAPVGSVQSPPTSCVEAGGQEEPKLDEISAAEAFAILDKGKKGFFTAKDV